MSALTTTAMVWAVPTENILKYYIVNYFAVIHQAENWWLRSPWTSVYDVAYGTYEDGNGNISNHVYDDSCGRRPAFGIYLILFIIMK